MNMLHSSAAYCLIFITTFLNVQCYRSNEDNRLETMILRALRRNACADPNECLSKWGFCGTGALYCGDGCKGGPCWSNNGGGNSDIIDSATFGCVFNTISSSARNIQFQGLRDSGWKPANKDEAAVFLAHVYHETGGLMTMREYCAPGMFHTYTIVLN